ncbi:hypothetical protein SAMN05880561_103196 [Rhizobium sp. RU33A]|uniref:hypothetical protein n=1 Tax=Rhizobium sp. RU33A TaxID=1907413 RepID=UPI000955114E|nr:hypothetical protein [Rhizobium sp. RU33A]SIQ49347.1 hypothetical protein SAMN05880561_103196 [Rhizobium sp. RU33A]
MDKASVDKKPIEPVTPAPEKRPTRRAKRGEKPRPDTDDVVRLEHERHKRLMDLLAK